MVETDSAPALRRRLPPHPSSVAEARRALRHAVQGPRLERLLDTAELLVSEVVTNALVHACTPIDVQVSLEDDTMSVAVRDGNPHPPRRRSYGLTAGTGRGLALLDELATEWGVDTLPDGKTVWFRLDDEPDGDETHHGGRVEGAGAGTEASDETDVLTVRLLEAPVLLLRAWQQHAQTLLREHLFATLDLGGEALETHAHANDALALLSDHVPGPDLDGDDGAMVVPGPDNRPRTLVVRMPVSSAAHFAVLCDALAAAQELADRGLLLNHPSQPELQRLGRWLCDQVDAQAAGGPATPWTLEIGRPPPARAPLEWDSSVVTQATEPAVAADDTNQVIAVSRAALDLLGYDDERGLVGGRLLQIIPSRFHEAHLTGFTLHFLTGRSTLLGRPVTVPARRRDGTETTVELMLEAHTAPHGRKVFVARLRPL